MQKKIRVVSVSGDGGVGKTTTSAAIATAFARQGLRTLLVTVDPARRLADVVEQRLSDSIAADSHQANLALWMPDAATEMERLARCLMTPAAAAEFVDSRVTQTFRAAPAGLHEAVVALSIQDAVEGYDAVNGYDAAGGYDAVNAYEALVIDTPPREQALSFFAAPANLRSLLDGKAVALFAALGSGRGLGQRVIERVLDRVLPAEVIAEGTSFFRSILRIREQLSTRAQAMQTLLDSARHIVVSSPSEENIRRAVRLQDTLTTKGQRPSLFINRVNVDSAEGLPSGATFLPMVEGSSRVIVETLANHLGTPLLAA